MSNPGDRLPASSRSSSMTRGCRSPRRYAQGDTRTPGQGATREQATEAYKNVNAIPIPWLDPVDISNAILWLASDEARYVTGTTQVVDACGTQPYRFPNVV